MTRLLCALFLLPFLSSCCFLCGGETRPLIPVTWEAPSLALKTLLVAIQNDDARRIYQSLAPSLKREQGIDGLGFAVAWEKLRERQPYLHVAGQAKLLREKPLSAQERIYLMGVHGQRFVIKLRKLYYWQVQLADEGELLTLGAYLPLTRFENSILDVSPDQGRILLELKNDELLGVRKDEIQSLRLATEWKVSAFAQGSGAFH